MEEQNRAIYNGIAFFRRPLRIGNKNVYGIIYNQKVERQRQNGPNSLPKYMTYLTAMEQFLHNGGDTDKTKNLWIFNGFSIQCNTVAFQSLLETLFKAHTKYSTIEFDKPLEYSSDEIDDCFVTNISFMDRYVFPNPDIITDRY